MKELVIISGKGGTGKTSVVAAFAALSQDMVLCDADVDAADLHLIMDPVIKEEHDFTGGHTAIIDQEKCLGCANCIGLCPKSALRMKNIEMLFDFEKRHSITYQRPYGDIYPEFQL